MPDQPPKHLLPPEDCQTMPQVRAGVDALDAELIALLARRFGYMRAAARIKPSRDAVRDEPRKAEVVANAVALAEAQGLPAGLIGHLWEQLVEGSIDYELGEWDSTRGA
jgi:isochorismate pyruvate lyase